MFQKLFFSEPASRIEKNPEKPRTGLSKLMFNCTNWLKELESYDDLEEMEVNITGRFSVQSRYD